MSVALDLGAGDLHLLVEELQCAGLVAGDALRSVERDVDLRVQAGQLLVERQRVGGVPAAHAGQRRLCLVGDGVERSDVDSRALRPRTLDLLDVAQLAADLSHQCRQVGACGADGLDRVDQHGQHHEQAAFGLAPHRWQEDLADVLAILRQQEANSVKRERTFRA